MFISSVDTPWVLNPADGIYTPELLIDPAHSGNIKKAVDITGADGIEIGGQMYYGGNYAKATGIQQDLSKGRAGGSGDPDWLTIQIQTDTLAAVDAIDNDPSDKYMVLWTEEIVEST